jgi:hypothetical protein
MKLRSIFIDLVMPLIKEALSSIQAQIGLEFSCEALRFFTSHANSTLFSPTEWFPESFLAIGFDFHLGEYQVPICG